MKCLFVKYTKSATKLKEFRHMYDGVHLNIVPEDLYEIQRIIHERDIIRTAYPSSIFDPYLLVDYIKQIHAHNAKFHAILDRNIFSAIISVIHNNSSKQLSDTQRATSALLAFFQISGTLIEPGMAIWELVDSKGCKQARGELSLFRAVDNLPPQQLIEVALKRTNSIKIDVDQIYDEPLNPKTGEDFPIWRVHYGIMLKIAIIESKGGKQSQKLEAFLDWLYTDYIFSNPAVVFAVIYFSRSRFRKMIKNLSTDDKSELLRGIRNATWDMTIVHYWGQKAKSDRLNNIFWLFCTEDNALKEIANYVIRSYDSPDDLEALVKKMFVKYLGDKRGQDAYDQYRSHVDRKHSEDRKINQCKSQEKIVTVNKELEKELLRLKAMK